MKRLAWGLRPLCVALGLGFASLPALTHAAEETSPGSPADCAPANGLAFVCGIPDGEDLAPLGQSPWLIVSSHTGRAKKPGALYAVNTNDKIAQRLEADYSRKPRKPYQACPGAPDLVTYDPHGLAYRAESAQRGTLLVVNHGGREAVEAFSVTLGAGAPKLVWLGCVVLPLGASGNGVVALSDGGFIVSKIYDTRLGNLGQQVLGKVRSGVVYRWNAATGFAQIPGTEQVGDNGIAATADEKTLLVNIWPEKRILRIDLTGAATPISIPIDFMPDNIRREEGGTFLVAGHVSVFETLASCKRALCPVDWAVARLDLSSGKIDYLLWEKGSPIFHGATGAVAIGKELWIGTYSGDRIAIAPDSGPIVK